MHVLKSIFTLLFLAVFFSLQGQGFYIKPGFNYGIALSRQIVKYTTAQNAYVKSEDFAEEKVNGERLVLRDNEKKENVPLGKGKVFSIELGYDSKKLLYYTLALNYGMMDKFSSTSFHAYSETNYNSSGTYFTRTSIQTEQIVTPVWYGIQPGIGFKTNAKKYKVFFGTQLFIGECKIRVIEINHYQSQSSYRPSYDGISGRNDVQFGSFIYGGSLNLGIEKIIGKNSSIGLQCEYRSMIYTPSKQVVKPINNYYYILGSVVPDSRGKNSGVEDISQYTRQNYLFESFSFGIYWKRYLFRKMQGDETVLQPI